MGRATWRNVPTAMAREAGSSARVVSSRRLAMTARALAQYGTMGHARPPVGAATMSNLSAEQQVDCPDAPGMARWLRETATNTRAKREAPYLSQTEINLAPHVAFRLEQAASMIEALHGADFHNIDDVGE